MTRPTSGGGTGDDDGELRVVAGVDGFECGTRALEFAAHEAALRGAVLHVVSAYGATPYATAWPPVLLESDHQGTAAAIVDESLSHTRGIDDTLGSKGEIRYGSACNVLVDVSHGATLLILGSRGRGHVASVLLGSVSEHCVHHAVCPISIVR